MIQPGQEDEEGDQRRRRKRKLAPAHPDKDPSDWKTPDAMKYFEVRWHERWPDEPVFPASKKLMAGIRGRFAWLDMEGIPRAAMKQVIDYLFDHWGQPLQDKLRWEESRPGLVLLSATWWFERLAKECGVKRSAPRVTHDSYDADAARRSRESADGWG